jgi:hypothetical protein
MTDDINTKKTSLMPILTCLGCVLVAFMVATGFGVFRVHIENLKTKTVWIFNAPSEDAVTLTPQDVQCIREKKCDLLEDGSIKTKG